MAELPNKQLIRNLLSATRKLTQFSGLRRQSNTFELAGARGCPQDRGRQTAFPESGPTRALPCGELTTSETLRADHALLRKSGTRLPIYSLGSEKLPISVHNAREI
jgi:hypothetical protein